MIKTLFTLFLSGSFIFFISACGNRTGGSQATAEETLPDQKSDSVIDEVTQFKYDKLIGNIPIPFDIFRMHADVPLNYNSNSVNLTSRLPLYVSSSSKAVNLGVYGGDLAYSITYEKFEDMGNYLDCAKKLADDLGIPLAFDQRTLITYKKYSTNKDSLEKMVFNSYNEVDKTLRSNERLGLASLVIAGGWLEGLYATLTTLKTSKQTEKSEILFPKIWEQKNYLEMIIGLLEQFNDDVFFVSFVQDLKSIKQVYDGLAVKSEMSKEEISTLTQQVNAVRNKIVTQ